MSQIRIEQNHSMATDDVRREVEALAMKLQERFGAQTQWRDDVLEFSGSGISGSIQVEPERVVVEADLGFMFAIMQGPIEEQIRRVLSERLH